VWEERELEERLQELIRNLTLLPLETVGHFKRLVNEAAFSGLETHLDKERRHVTELGGQPRFREHVSRFFAKR
jgi:enoyl-CoA hydratase/carnithine racemase